MPAQISNITLAKAGDIAQLPQIGPLDGNAQITLAGNFVGTQLAFESSADGINWQAINAVQQGNAGGSGALNTVSTPVAVADAQAVRYVLTFYPGSLQSLRVRCLQMSSGSMQVGIFTGVTLSPTPDLTTYMQSIAADMRKLVRGISLLIEIDLDASS